MTETNTKITCMAFPDEIAKCLVKPRVDIIKTRKDGKDIYTYEISANGVKPFVLDPKDARPAGDYPDLEDTWCGGQWQGKKYNGCDFDLNLFDRNEYGDDGIGVGACIYSCYQVDDDYATTNTEDYVKATVKCWFQDENGKRTEFKCSNAEQYLQLYGQWDGKTAVKPAKTRRYKVSCTATIDTTYECEATSAVEARTIAIASLDEAYRRAIPGDFTMKVETYHACPVKGKK